MPLPPLPENNTSRLWVDYLPGTSQPEHTVMLRLAPDQEGPISAMDWLQGVLAALGAANLNSGWRALRARYSPAGAVFSLPQSLTAGLAGILGTGSLAGYRPQDSAIEATFQMRSPTSGRRGDFSLYGLRKWPLSTYRYTAGGSDAGLNAMIAALSVPAGVGNYRPATIDGTLGTFYPYVNFNYNSYWEGELRKSGL